MGVAPGSPSLRAPRVPSTTELLQVGSRVTISMSCRSPALRGARGVVKSAGRQYEVAIEGDERGAPPRKVNRNEVTPC
tara:strand:- start:564 stop:797 length:234 start_codon:yes stop_codon:yes gene_type:complete